MYDKIDCLQALRALPQFDLLPPERVNNWVNNLLSIPRDKPLSFYIERLGGVGGSEASALIAYYHPSETNRNLRSGSFKTAEEISREKLLLSSPFSTPAAKRGNEIEPFIRDLFLRMNPSLKSDPDGMKAATFHASHPHARGNPDDVFVNSTGKRILPDYKSTIDDNEEERFSNIVQLNLYAENMRSNNSAADIACTVKLVAKNEDVFADIIEAYNLRDEDPERYDFWIKSIAQNKLKCAKLVVSQVNVNPEFGALIVKTIDRFMNESVLAGKVLSESAELTVLIDDEKKKAEQLEGELFHLLTAENAITNLRKYTETKIEALRNSVGNPFEWPERFPVSIKAANDIDVDAALEALKLSGYDVASLYTPSPSGIIDVDKLEKKYKELGGIIDSSVIQNNLSKEKLTDAVRKCGLSLDDFTLATKINTTLSRKKAMADHQNAESIQWSQALYSQVLAQTQADLEALPDTTDDKKQTHSVSMG